jgi:hypothetical protein
MIAHPRPSRAARLVLAGLAALVLAVPAAAKLRTKQADGVDLAKFETYRWSGAKTAVAPDLDRQLRKAADETLAERGLRLAGAEEEADLELAYIVGTADMLSAGIRVEADWWGSLWAVPAGESYTSAGLGWYLTDLESGRVVWAGAWTQKSTNDYGSMTARKQAPENTRKILSKYPKR